MQDLITNFGINPYLLVAQIVNFLIIFYILKRFAYKPVLKLLEKRRQTIEEGQRNAEQAQLALQKALDEEKRILKNAQSEAKKILEDANARAETLIAGASEKGRKQVEKMLLDAKEEIARDRRDVEKQLASHVTRLSVDMLEKALQGLFTEKEQLTVLQKTKELLKE